MDGSTFHTRKGREIAAPIWLTKSLPKTLLDCELWFGNGKLTRFLVR
jgi:hypothetical protein